MVDENSSHSLAGDVYKKYKKQWEIMCVQYFGASDYCRYISSCGVILTKFTPNGSKTIHLSDKNCYNVNDTF